MALGSCALARRTTKWRKYKAVINDTLVPGEISDHFKFVLHFLLTYCRAEVTNRGPRPGPSSFSTTHTSQAPSSMLMPVVSNGTHCVNSYFGPHVIILQVVHCYSKLDGVEHDKSCATVGQIGANNTVEQLAHKGAEKQSRYYEVA